MLSLVSNSSSSIIKSCQLSNPNTSNNIPRHLDQLSITPLVGGFPGLSVTISDISLDGHERVTRAYGAAFRIWSRRPFNEKQTPKKAQSTKILSNKSEQNKTCMTLSRSVKGNRNHKTKVATRARQWYRGMRRFEDTKTNTEASSHEYGDPHC